MIKLAELKIGDTLIADSGFTCLSKNERCRVHKDAEGDLYVKCKMGVHYLEGQLDKDDNLVGFRRP